MTAVSCWQELQTDTVSSGVLEAGPDSGIGLEVAFDETLQWVGQPKANMDARACLKKIRDEQFEQRKLEFEQKKDMKFERNNIEVKQKSTRPRSLFGSGFRTEYTQTVVMSATVHIVGESGETIVNEDLVIPPKFLCNTTAEALTTMVLRELEFIVGCPIDEWVNKIGGQVTHL